MDRIPRRHNHRAKRHEIVVQLLACRAYILFQILISGDRNGVRFTGLYRNGGAGNADGLTSVLDIRPHC